MIVYNVTRLLTSKTNSIPIINVDTKFYIFVVHNKLIILLGVMQYDKNLYISQTVFFMAIKAKNNLQNEVRYFFYYYAKYTKPNYDGITMI